MMKTGTKIRIILSAVLTLLIILLSVESDRRDRKGWS
jgi:hypothetical protein